LNKYFHFWESISVLGLIRLRDRPYLADLQKLKLSQLSWHNIHPIQVKPYIITMKHDEKILADYYGALYYIKENKDNELTIFVVDDDEFYLKLLEAQLSKNPKFEVFTFPSGDKCLESLKLNPDLVILDYHLDGVKANQKKGDEIAIEIKKNLPKAEIIIISSDHKLALVDELSQPKILFKDGFVKDKIHSVFSDIRSSRKRDSMRNAIFPTLLLSIILTFIIIYFKI